MPDYTDDGKQGPTPEEVADDTVSLDEPEQPLFKPPHFKASIDELNHLRKKLDASLNVKRSYPLYYEPEISKIEHPRAAIDVRCKTAADGEYQALSRAIGLFGDTDLTHYHVLQTYQLFLSKNTSDGDVWTGQMVVEYLGHAPSLLKPRQEPGT